MATAERSPSVAAGNKDALGGAVLGGDGLRVVSERSRRHVDARTAHGHEVTRPVGVPTAIAPRIGDPGVETDLVVIQVATGNAQVARRDPNPRD